MTTTAPSVAYTTAEDLTADLDISSTISGNQVGQVLVRFWLLVRHQHGAHSTTQPLTITAITAPPTATNAYINALARLNPGTDTNDIILSSFAYDAGPLSRLQTTNSTVWNTGSVTNASLMQMWHYGTRTSVTMIETNTVIDIGWHAPSSTLSGGTITLADADGDGRIDAWEDLDGDGVFDFGTGETDWLITTRSLESARGRVSSSLRR